MTIDPVLLILDALRGADCAPERNGSGWIAQCPSHDDRRPSLSIGTGEDGRALLHCYAGCETRAVLGALGLQERNLFPASRNGSPGTPRRGSGLVHKRPDFARLAEQAASRLDDDALRALADSLNVGPDALRALGFGALEDAYSWPERDGAADIVGLGTRDASGAKKCVSGSRRGLIYDPATIENGDAPLVIVEGASDCASALTLGLRAVGLAQAGGSTDALGWLARLIERIGPPSVIVIGDADEAGERGAARVADHLARHVTIPVRVAAAPEGAADLRELLSEVVARGLALADAEACHKVGAALLSEVMSAPVLSCEGDDKPEAPAWAPFPVESLPEPMRALVVEGAEAIGCDPSMIALPAIASAASSIGASRAVQVKPGWVERATVWAAVVAQSGTAKTHAMRLAVDPLREAQTAAFAAFAPLEKEHSAAEKQYRAKLRAWERARGDDLPPTEPEAPVCERLIVSDTTIEALAPILEQNPRGVLVDRDELGAWLRSFGAYKAGRGGDCEAWLSIFDSSPVVIDRKTSGTLHVANPHVCIAGTIQPEALTRALGDEYFDNGLAARFLFAHPPARASRYTEAVVAQATRERWAAALATLRSLRPSVAEDGGESPIVAEMSDDAKREWIELHDELADRIDGADARLAAALSKLRASAAKLALVFHLLHEAGDLVALREPSPIGIEATRAACEVARWFASETDRIYGRMAESPEDADQRALIDWIRARGSVTPRDLARMLARFRGKGGSERATDALRELEEAGLGTIEYPDGRTLTFIPGAA